MQLLHLRQLRGWLMRLFGLLDRSRREREFAEELESHLAFHIEDNLRAGMSPDEARRQALIKLGGVTLAQELHREQRGLAMFETLVQDLRFGFRLLRRNPGFSFVAILTLALGIGANTAIFSLMDAIFWRPLPVSQPEELVCFAIPSRVGPETAPQALLREFQNGNQVFMGALASNTDGLSLTVAGTTERVMGEVVTGNYFSLLGVNAFRGRAFSAEISRGDWAPEAVLSYDFWQRRFGSDDSVVGKTIQLNGYPFTIVGVSPPHFFGTRVGFSPEVRFPKLPDSLNQTMPAMPLLNPKNYTAVVARLKPGVSFQQAQAATEVLYQRLLQDDPQFSRPTSFRGTHLQLLSAARGTSDLRREFGRPLTILLGMVALVLLIACANLANLLLGRAQARRQEIGVRLAIGAGRVRLMRQLLTESLLISCLGGALGVGLAYWGVDILFGFLPQNHIRTLLEVKPDVRALGFTFAVTILTGFLFGLAPALHATRLELVSALKSRGAGARRRVIDLRQALVVAEVALSVLLLIGAAFFMRTLQNLRAVDAGFKAENVLLFTMKHVHQRYTPAQLRNFCRELLERVEGLPGVRSASLAGNGPFSGREDTPPVAIPGTEPQVERLTYPIVDRVKTAIIDERVALDFFSGMNPIGRRIAIGQAPNLTEFEIIGLVKATKQKSIRETDQGAVYLSLLQGDRPWMPTLFVQTTNNTAALTAAVRQTFQGLDKDLPVFNVKTFEQQLNESLAQDRLVATLSGFFGVLAALLAAIGLYGVMAYAVARRTREIGIRLALGAQPVSVLWLVLREALGLALIGMVIGLGGALLATRLISSLLFGLTPTDLPTIAIAALLMLAVAALAGYLPARRASRVDPLVALSHE
jgi:ABC-type antimicrobial peptide transport system permease subunit